MFQICRRRGEQQEEKKWGSLCMFRCVLCLVCMIFGVGECVGGGVAFLMLYKRRQQLLSVVFSLFLWPWELGSGRVSLATRCMTVVRPGGSFRAPRVTFPWRKRPWKIRRSILGLLTCSSSHPAGQLSNTCLAMSVAESFGEKVKSCVLPLTRIRRRCTRSLSFWVVMAQTGRRPWSWEDRTGALQLLETGPEPCIWRTGWNISFS